ncbi:MAG: PAS domain-containing protein [Acidobacteriota bacterium]|nr:PAS domain-containing protein [Acidobacteriota bacterium]
MERTDLEQWKAREVARLLALVETERRYYQEIVAAVPVGLLVLAQDLSIVSSNREVRKIFGLRSGEPVGARLETLLPPAAFDRVREVLESGSPQNDVFIDTQEEPARHLRVSIQSIRTWDDDKENEALVTIQDLSALPLPSDASNAAGEPGGNLLNGALPASELLENLDAVVWAAELPSMKFLYVNEKAQELLGYPAETWLNTPDFWKERIHPEDRDWVVKSYERAMDNWSRHSCEYRAQTSYGKVLWMRETARLLVDEQGKTKHLIGIAVEVTQRKILEDQAIRSQRVDALGKLGTRVSREIHNLLMVISGYGEELIHGLPESHPLHADLQEILSATDRLRGLANQLSLFSRRPSSQPSPVDLSSFMSRIQPAVQNALGEKVHLDVKMFPATIGVQADPAHLEQLVLALAQRSQSVMNDGGTFTIECSPLEITEDLRSHTAVLRPGVYATISIEDDGPTPGPDARAATFESIGTVRESKDRRELKDLEVKDNPALLARLYGFVRQWGGDISVSPNSPRGTAFQIYLQRIAESSAPSLRATEETATENTAAEENVVAQPEPAGEHPAPAPDLNAEAAAAPDPPPVPEPEPVRETILIAEQDAGIRALVKKILKRQNYIVIEAGSAEDAIKAAEEHGGTLDLLIADVAGSQLDGSRLTKKVTEQYPGTKVLYLSGYTDDPSAESADVPENAAFLQKPFTLGSLLTKVKVLLGTKPE